MKNFLTSINYSDSWELAKKSFLFLVKNKDLNLLPLLNLMSLTVCLTMVFYVLPSLVTHPYYFSVSLALLYLSVSFIVIYFNSVLVSVVLQRLLGKEASLFYGFVIANKRILFLIKWSMIACTIGLVAKLFEFLQQMLEKTLGLSLGFSWESATFFILPFLIDENIGPTKAMKRSLNTIGKGFKITISILSFAEIFSIILLLILCEFDIFYPIELSNQLLSILPILMVTFVFTLAIEAIVISAIYLHTRGLRKPHNFDAMLLNRAFIKEE